MTVQWWRRRQSSLIAAMVLSALGILATLLLASPGTVVYCGVASGLSVVFAAAAIELCWRRWALFARAIDICRPRRPGAAGSSPGATGGSDQRQKVLAPQ